MSLKTQNRKRILVLAGIIITSILAEGLRITLPVILFYVSNSSKTTYYIAYIGRYDRPGFDRLSELALGRYIEELNSEMKSARLELKSFDIRKPATSKKVYEELSKNDKFVVVIDNTWGIDLRPVASLIRENNIPVIAINADKQDTDFSNNAVFIGHDDNVPRGISVFADKVLKNKEIIFITEENYALTSQFLKELDSTAIKVAQLGVSSLQVAPDEKSRLFESLDMNLNEMRNRQQMPTVILNTHASWGDEIINHIDSKHTGVTILGGPYIVSWTKPSQFGNNNNGNSLIMLTNPTDAIINKVHLDLKSIRSTNDEVSQIVNAQLFVKRCLDAMSIIRGVFYDESTQTFRSIITRSDFISFFQKKLAASEYIGKDDLYEFDGNLLLFDEKAFEKHSKGEVFSYPKQLNSRKEVIPNVYFGLEIINISNIDIENRSFHADFFYWLKFNSEHVENYIHFRNEKTSNEDNKKLISSPPKKDDQIYKLYKMSADFNMDVDLGKYPLDTQELRIELELINPADTLRISFDHASFKQTKIRAKDFSLGEWDTGDFYVTVDNFVGSSLWGASNLENKKPQRFKTLNVRMPIHRRWTSPLVTIILPLIMMGLAAIALLYVKDSSFSNIGEVCVGIFLSIVTYSIAFAQITPRSNALTIADILFYATFFTVLLIFLKVIILNSSLISERARVWTSDRATPIGFGALAAYCLMIVVLIIYGLR